MVTAERFSDNFHLFSWNYKLHAPLQGQRPEIRAAWARGPGKWPGRSKGLKARGKRSPRMRLDRAFSPHASLSAVPGPLAQAGMVRTVGAAKFTRNWWVTVTVLHSLFHGNNKIRTSARALRLGQTIGQSYFIGSDGNDTLIRPADYIGLCPRRAFSWSLKRSRSTSLPHPTLLTVRESA
jgi:hypothetical protein